jgi:UDP-MurNAc hydroxylase
MNSSQSSITFINHASVLITGKQKSLLTDPWYHGDAFHRGWRLIYENDPAEIAELLWRTNYIWISHEHPDHFSVAFYRKYKEIIQRNNIVTLFQSATDGRVMGFLNREGFKASEMANNAPYVLEENFVVKVVKDEFYDSALLAEVDGIRIFNLNDCPIRSTERIRSFKRKHGTCDILLTQFSYAAWKGGKDNRKWRESAAKDKLACLLNQGTILESKVVIPFASFVRFSNVMNSYLNDSVNTPRRVADFCLGNEAPFRTLFLKPLEDVKLATVAAHNSEGIEFWQEKYNDIAKQPLEMYSESFSAESLTALFRAYCERIKAKNSWRFIKALRKFRIFGAFAPVTIKLLDTGEVVLVDIPQERLVATTEQPDVFLYSASLAFIFNNPFGFDTLTINGNFEEARKGGFKKLTMNFAIENLNNLGYAATPLLAFDVSLISIFLKRLVNVEHRLN